MPLTKVKTRSSPANTATITHRERIALLYEPEAPSPDTGQLGKGHTCHPVPLAARWVAERRSWARVLFSSATGACWGGLEVLG